MEFEALKMIIEWEKEPGNEFYIEPENFETENLKGFEVPIKKKDSIILLNDLINFSMLKTFKPRKDDIFVIGFPKSGYINFLNFNLN